MWFWWFMFACGLIIPLIMVIAGILMWKRCPKTINYLYGYRTERSMKNRDTWKFAHDHCGRLWLKIGLLMLIPSALVYIPFYNSGEAAISVVGLIVCAVQLVVLIASIFPTEAALKKTFNDDGTRK